MSGQSSEEPGGPGIAARPAVALTLLWTAAILGATVLVRAPVPRPILERAATLAVDVLVATLLAGAALGLGVRVLGRLDLPGLTAPGWFGLAGLLGWGLCGLVWLGLATAGALNSLSALSFVAVSAVVAAKPLLSFWRHRPAGSPTPGLLGWFIVVTATLSLVRALVPPTAFDGLFYHLFLPQQWIAQGTLRTWQHFPHEHFPHLVEALFLPAMLLGSDIAAALVHWTFLPLLVATVWHLTSRFLPTASPSLAGAIVLGTPIVPLLASAPYSDIALAGAQTGSLVALLHWRTTGRLSWTVVSGSLAGVAMGVKLTSFAWPLTAVGLLGWSARHRPREALQPILVFTVAAWIVAAPWYLRTLAETGNPIYPFVFGGPDWDAGRAAHYAGRGTGLGADLLKWLLLPFLVTLGIGDSNAWDAVVGPLFLGLLPLACWIWIRGCQPGASPEERPVVGMLAVAAGVQLAFWCVGVAMSAYLRQGRLLLTGLVWVAPVLAWTLAQIPSNGAMKEATRALRLVVGIGLLLALLEQVSSLALMNPLPWLTGRENRDQFYAERMGGFAEAMAATQTLPADARLLFLWEPRGYLSRRPSQPDAILDEFRYALRTYGDQDAVADHWRAAGYTHLLVSWRNLFLVIEHQPRMETASGPMPAQLTRGERAAFERLVDSHTQEVWRSGDGQYSILRLVDK